VLENWLSWLAGDLAMPGCGLEEAVRRLAGGSRNYEGSDSDADRQE